MANARRNNAWRPVDAYTTGYHYGRSLRGYELRYLRERLTIEDATAHAERMADPYTGHDARAFVQGFLGGYALDDREAAANPR